LSISAPAIFKNLKIILICFQKNQKINLDIVNDVTYKHAKFNYEILYIVGYTKKMLKFRDLKYIQIHTFVIFV
jgi:hypothetical protein